MGTGPHRHGAGRWRHLRAARRAIGEQRARLPQRWRRKAARLRSAARASALKNHGADNGAPCGADGGPSQSWRRGRGLEEGKRLSVGPRPSGHVTGKMAAFPW